MKLKVCRATGIAAAIACTGAMIPTPAFAAAEAGVRVFPVTLTFDDPAPGDEASMPTITYLPHGNDGGPDSYAFGFEFDKRITGNFGVGINDSWSVFTGSHPAARSGFGDIALTAKYEAYVNAAHEFIASAGIVRVLGGTGTQRAGAAPSGSTAPTVYLGKGFGDLPIGDFRPIAITASAGYSMADTALKAAPVIDPVTGARSLQYNNGSANQWFAGISVQYSLPYLQSEVRHTAAGRFSSHLIPLVEFSWSSPATSPSAEGAAWIAAPGVIYFTDTYQVAVEALIPGNRAAGRNIGIIFQLHVFFDDLFPQGIGRPIFG